MHGRLPRKNTYPGAGKDELGVEEFAAEGAVPDGGEGLDRFWVAEVDDFLRVRWVKEFGASVINC